MLSVRRTLKIGMTGPDVRKVQEILAYNLGYLNPSDVTGHFDSKTKKAVMEFQDDYGINVDGIVGPQTWGALDDAAYTVEQTRREKTIGKPISDFLTGLTSVAKEAVGLWGTIEQIKLAKKLAPTLVQGQAVVKVPTVVKKAKAPTPGRVYVKKESVVAKILPIMTIAGIALVIVYIVTKKG